MQILAKINLCLRYCYHAFCASINRNDIVVFISPYDVHKSLCKRLTAMVILLITAMVILLINAMVILLITAMVILLLVTRVTNLYIIQVLVSCFFNNQILVDLGQ